MGNTISDALYPDNPNRRERAGQLKDDIENFCNQFNTMKASRDKTLKEIGPRLSRFLKSQGYSSPEELDAKVRETLKDDALKQYVDIYNKHNRDSAIESTIFQICSVASVSSGVFLGGLVMTGIMAGAAAITCLEIVLGVAAIIGVVMIILAAIQGSKERADLQDAIQKMAFQRVKVCQAVRNMNAITNWLESIRDWLDNPKVLNNPERLQKKLESGFKEDFAEGEHGRVVKYLTKMDADRGAWTNEDPNWRVEQVQTRKLASSAISGSDHKLVIKYDLDGQQKSFEMGLEKQLSSDEDLMEDLMEDLDISSMETDVGKLLNNVFPDPDASVNCFSKGKSYLVQIEGLDSALEKSSFV